MMVRAHSVVTQRSGIYNLYCSLTGLRLHIGYNIDEGDYRMKASADGYFYSSY